MFDFQFFTDQEIYDILNYPYLITIHLVNGQQFTVGLDTEEQAISTGEFICEALTDEEELLYCGYAVVKLTSVVSITLTRQN